MKTLLLILVAVLVSACSDNHPASVPAPQTYVASAQPAPAAPVVVQQSDSGVSSALLGGIAGYMLGSSGSRQAAAPAQVVERHHFYRVEREPKAAPAQPAAAPAPQAAPSAPAAKAPSYAAAPSPKPTVTYSGTLASTRSYSAPSYTSRPGAYSARR